MLRAKKWNISPIFCRFSKVSDLSSPLGRRKGVCCQGLSKGSSGCVLLKESCSVVQETHLLSPRTWHCARGMGNRDSSHSHKKDPFPGEGGLHFRESIQGESSF